MAGPADIIPAVTIANYALGAWDGLSQQHPALKALREKADWEYDAGGDSMSGAVEVGRHKAFISAPGMDLTSQLTAKNRHARWTAPWGEVTAATSIDLGVLRRNSGGQALVKLRDKEVPAMIRDTIIGAGGLLDQFFNQDLLAAGVTGLPLGGLPSFLYAPGTPGLQGFDGISTYTGANVANTDREAVPPSTKTYLGLTTAPSGVSGGGISGVDNIEKDAWTPTLVNAKSSVFGGASFKANILPALQWLANRCRRFSANDASLRPDPMTSGWCSFDVFSFLGDAISAKQTIFLQGKGKGNADITAVSSGVDDGAIPHAGMLWRWDERITATLTAFLINWSQVKWRVQPLYAGIEGPGNPLNKAGEDAGILETAITYDPVRRQWLVTSTHPGQCIFMPRYFGRAGEYA